MASLDDLVTVGNSFNKNISQLIVSLQNFQTLYQGVIDVAHGGTGQTTLTANSVLTGNGVNPIIAEPLFVCDDNGKVGIGTASPTYLLTVGDSTIPAGATLSTSLFSTNTAAGAVVGIRKSVDNINSARLDFYKSRGTTSSPTIIQNGDVLSTLNFTGFDGTNYVAGGAIQCISDATPGTNDMPGRLTFSTTADGASAVTERMRIDNAGNVGIGTVNATLTRPFQVYATAEWPIVLRYSNDTTTNRPTYLCQRSRGTTASPTVPTSGTYIGGIEAGGYNTSIYTSGFNGGAGILFTADATWTTTSNPTYMSFFTNISGSASYTERMRIDPEGIIYTGTTNFGSFVTGSKPRLQITSDIAQQNSLVCRNTATANGSRFITFINSGNTVCGSISQPTDASVSYNTSSDYRLKENVQPITNALNRIMFLNPVTFTWKKDKAKGEGFIAHELQEHIPLAVSGNKDALNEDKSINPQQVDFSKIVCHLVAALQELKQEFDEYKKAHP